jgi:cobalt/nickel transport protein
MKKWILAQLAALAITLTVGGAAWAHFQMVYTPDSALTRGGSLDFRVVFTHPFEAGHTMDMSGIDQLFVLHKGKKKDLLKKAQPIEWTSLTNKGKAYKFTDKLRGMGDWVYCLVPGPYYEKNEDIYIQQITKSVVNVNGSPTDWDAEVGLDAEIIPLDKPYGLWTGNVFRGVVKSAGRPVPFAEIEVEYMNHKPLMAENAFAKKAEVEKVPNDAFVTMMIKADANGEFAFGIPKAGWWGFCALGVGPKKEFKGKELSQDAVIWVQAFDMK